jgi:15-cis-phytoene synthase
MSLDACAALVERGDPDRFLAAMAAPPAARAMLFPLYAFNLEVARAPWVTQEPLIAEMRLQWWRDAVDEIGEGKRPRAHEVVGPLAGVIQARGLPVVVFDKQIAARRWDIEKRPFDDLPSLIGHLDATGAGLIWLSALALGAEPGMEPQVRRVGLAGAIASWLLAVPDLEARGRYPLPDSRPAAVAALAEQGLAALRKAKGARFGAATPAVRAAWRAGDILKLAAKEPDRVAEGTLGTSEFRRRASLMWRVATNRW